MQFLQLYQDRCLILEMVLKPVHRRIIYSMYQLKLLNGSPFKKCARIVGDVMGKFHPHGDQAIYDSLVRFISRFFYKSPLNRRAR